MRFRRALTSTPMRGTALNRTHWLPSLRSNPPALWLRPPTLPPLLLLVAVAAAAAIIAGVCTASVPRAISTAMEPPKRSMAYAEISVASRMNGREVTTHSL